MTQQREEKKENPTRSWNQLEIDNTFLKQQNIMLNKELSLTRYTINALKGITLQKENALNETRQELERALHHIQLLSYTLKEQKKRNSLTLVQDNELSDDLSEEDDILEKRPIDIMSILPLRKPLYNNDQNMIIDF